MPPSGRKGKTRARKAVAAETQNYPSDAETPEAIPTPTRGSRKRGRATEALPTTRNIKRKLKDTRGGVEREDTEGTEAQEQSDGETEPSAPTEQEIIQSLKVADKHVNATEDFANDLLEGQENVPGFGKIAGRDWVFIIRKLEINIGRPETHERLVAEENGHGPMPSARSVVDIDLGPDRQVSRIHATILYESDKMQWAIIVNGRNGLRVDNNLYKRGSKTYLRNGSVIEIANTQMAFITTPAEDNEGPIWDASIIRQAQKSSEEDEDGDEDPRNNTRQNGSSTSRGQLQNTSVYQSDYNGQPQGQQGHHQTNQNQQQRSHPHSQRANLQTTPGTPMRSQQMFTNKSSPAANYARGVMMESTESIDYSADSAKDLKPPHSYAQLIGMAILSTSEQQMTLNNIYKWIMANYAFYRFNTGGWQNSIRHNLSLNKAFTKIARRTDEPGKGMKWMIEPTEFENFVQQGMKGCRRPNPITGSHSVLGSPTSPVNVTRAGLKRDEEVTPPLNSYRAAYPTALEAYTPDRGPRRQTSGSIEDGIGLGINGSNIHDAEFAIRTTPRNGMTAAANAAGSPPALYVNDEGRVGPLDTPFPLRPTHRLAPPSTLRRPSDFIQFSSPAPFWKMEGLMGSTPFKPIDLSPLKTPFPSLKKAMEAKKERTLDDSQDGKDDNTDDGGDDGMLKPKGSPIIGSSSPPRPEGAVHGLDPPSPTMSRPATAVAKTLSQLASATREHSNPARARTGSPLQQQTPPATAASASSQRTSSGQAIAAPQDPAPTSFDTAPTTFNSFVSTSQPSYDSTYTTATSAGGGFNLADDGEDEGIDLVKGFQPIGAYHQRNHLTMSMGIASASAYGR